MSISKTYNFEFTIVLDDDQQDIFDKIDAMIKRETFFRLPSIRVDGYLSSIHRHILRRHNIRIPKNMEVDHVNIDNLDNRLENLRVVTRSQNSKNKTNSAKKQSKYIGVRWHKQSAGWQVLCVGEIERKTIGIFNKFNKLWHEIDAAVYYDTKVRELKLDKPLNFQWYENQPFIEVVKDDS